MKIKIYIINLARSKHRRQHITKQLNNVNVQHTFVNAVDGKNKKTTDFAEYNQNTINITGKELKSTEVGAFLSHIKALKQAKKDKVDWAIVLEDDVVVSTRFNDILTHITNTDANCIRMYTRNAGIAKNKTKISSRKNYDNWGGALGYAINKVAIDNVLTIYKDFYMKIDNFLFGWWGHGLTIDQVNKNLIDIEQNIASDIGYDKSDEPKSKPLKRLIYKVKYHIGKKLN